MQHRSSKSKKRTHALAAIPVRNIHIYQTRRMLILKAPSMAAPSSMLLYSCSARGVASKRRSLCSQSAYSDSTQVFQGPTHSSCSIFVMCLPGTTTSPTYLFRNGICGFDIPAFSAAALMTASEGGRYSCVRARMILHSCKQHVSKCSIACAEIIVVLDQYTSFDLRKLACRWCGRGEFSPNICRERRPDLRLLHEKTLLKTGGIRVHALTFAPLSIRLVQGP